MGAAETVSVLSKCWRPSPQLGRLAVVPDEPPLAITEVHGTGDGIECARPHRDQAFVLAWRTRFPG
ncbi:hypothetical protein D3C84_1095910 [compost metagenome]